MVASLIGKTGVSQLAQCEEIIERGLDSFIEVGNALLQIREGRLYREDYDDFETYCQERWEMCGRRAHQLIESAKVIANISSTEQIVQFPRSESQVRPLTSLPLPIQRVAWTEAVTTAKRPGKPTAEEVRAAVIRLVPEVRTKAVTVRTNGTIKNSPVLRELKRSWKQATSPDREAFRNWIGEHP
jgi:hypothetical protein